MPKTVINSRVFVNPLAFQVNSQVELIHTAKNGKWMAIPLPESCQNTMPEIKVAFAVAYMDGRLDIEAVVHCEDNSNWTLEPSFGYAADGPAKFDGKVGGNSDFMRHAGFRPMAPLPTKAKTLFLRLNAVTYRGPYKVSVTGVSGPLGSTAKATLEHHAPGPYFMPSTRDVMAERHRQITNEGWTPAHDDQHAPNALTNAARSYLTRAIAQIDNLPGLFSETPPSGWPWAKSWWKPADVRRNLVKSAALILAHIDRLDRTDEIVPVTETIDVAAKITLSPPYWAEHLPTNTEAIVDMETFGGPKNWFARYYMRDGKKVVVETNMNRNIVFDEWSRMASTNWSNWFTDDRAKPGVQWDDEIVSCTGPTEALLEEIRVLSKSGVRSILFVGTNAIARRLADRLKGSPEKRGPHIIVIIGSLPAASRDRALTRFAEKPGAVLIATALMAVGWGAPEGTKVFFHNSFTRDEATRAQAKTRVWRVTLAEHVKVRGGRVLNSVRVSWPTPPTKPIGPYQVHYVESEAAKKVLAYKKIRNRLIENLRAASFTKDSPPARAALSALAAKHVPEERAIAKAKADHGRKVAKKATLGMMYGGTLITNMAQYRSAFADPPWAAGGFLMRDEVDGYSFNRHGLSPASDMYARAAETIMAKTSASRATHSVTNAAASASHASTKKASDVIAETLKMAEGRLARSEEASAKAAVDATRASCRSSSLSVVYANEESKVAALHQALRQAKIDELVAENVKAMAETVHALSQSGPFWNGKSQITVEIDGQPLSEGAEVIVRRVLGDSLRDGRMKR